MLPIFHPVAASATARKRVHLSGLILSMLVLTAGPATAQSLNDLQDLLGGNDSALVPAKSAEPTLTVRLNADSKLQAGSLLTLSVQVQTPADAYVYSQSQSFGGATKITITEVYGIEAVDETFSPEHPPKVVFEEVFQQDVEKFPGGITWKRKYKYTGNVPADQIYLTGQIDYQVCDAKRCRKFHEAFEVFPGEPAEETQIAAAEPPVEAMPPQDLPPAPEPAAEVAAAQPQDSDEQTLAASYGESSQAAPPPLTYDIQSPVGEGSLPWYLTLAFFGGLILNVMPCVLPVLAIKVMSFVQQAGESRGRVLALNISYSLGVIGVFLVLATLAVRLKMSWGGLFQRPEFNLVMIGVVFAMALSLIGVFEVKLPGSIGAVGGQHREGLLGAFLTGIFATVLATPCTAPLMGTALTWSLRQETAVVYLVWGVMGLGMAAPYLVVAMVPSIARMLPRPGDWMLRFKEASGILLMGAVVWLLRGMQQEVIVPMLFVLVGVATALWMIGSLYNHNSTSRRKWIVRGLAAGLLLLVGLFGTRQYQAGMQQAEQAHQKMQELAARAAGNAVEVASTAETNEDKPIPAELPWEPFSTERLEGLLRSGMPVLVDFSATWCANCKVNEEWALNTQSTAEFVHQNGVTTLYADYTREDPEIKFWLDRFNAIGIPLTVIFPAREPQEKVVPIILDGVFSQSKLLSQLRKAVPEKLAAGERQSVLLDGTTR